MLPHPQPDRFRPVVGNPGLDGEHVGGREIKIHGPPSGLPEKVLADRIAPYSPVDRCWPVTAGDDYGPPEPGPDSLQKLGQLKRGLNLVLGHKAAIRPVKGELSEPEMGGELSRERARGGQGWGHGGASLK
jgi:hypothetical protein